MLIQNLSRLFISIMIVISTCPIVEQADFKGLCTSLTTATTATIATTATTATIATIARHLLKLSPTKAKASIIPVRQ